ncbi:MAG: hypothetical protein R3F62_14295 [Planctomycetota bacterium]
MAWGGSGGDTFLAAVFVTELAGFARDAAGAAPRDVALRTNAVLHLVTEALLASDGVRRPPQVTHRRRGSSARLGADACAAGVDAAPRPAGGERQCPTSRSPCTGDVFLGKLGHPDYASLDVIGDAVNTTFLALGWAVAEHPGVVRGARTSSPWRRLLGSPSATRSPCARGTSSSGATP